MSDRQEMKKEIFTGDSFPEFIKKRLNFFYKGIIILINSIYANNKQYTKKCQKKGGFYGNRTKDWFFRNS